MSKGGMILESHFDSMERQSETARLGMWIFLASEILLFGALFALYAAYRSAWPEAFAEGVRENDAVLGTTNTLVLITSSLFAALAADRLERGRPRATLLFLALTIVLAVAFLVIKSVEYGAHFREGIFPGGRGGHFAHAPAGTPIFFTLYFGMTGLHALHVIVGMGVLSWCALRVRRGTLSPNALEIGALYWHLVDCVWIFLWPCYYLLRG